MHCEDAPFNDGQAASKLRMATQRLLDTSAYKELQPQLESLSHEVSGKAVFISSKNRKQMPTHSSY